MVAPRLCATCSEIHDPMQPCPAPTGPDARKLRCKLCKGTGRNPKGSRVVVRNAERLRKYDRLYARKRREKRRLEKEGQANVPPAEQ